MRPARKLVRMRREGWPELVTIPRMGVSVSTLRRVTIGVWLLSVAREMVCWMMTLRAWVWGSLMRSGGITSLIVGFVEEVHVDELAQHRCVGMAGMAGLTVARLERPRAGIRVATFAMRNKGRVR